MVQAGGGQVEPSGPGRKVRICCRCRWSCGRLRYRAALRSGRTAGTWMTRGQRRTVAQSSARAWPYPFLLFLKKQWNSTRQTRPTTPLVSIPGGEESKKKRTPQTKVHCRTWRATVRLGVRGQVLCQLQRIEEQGRGVRPGLWRHKRTHQHVCRAPDAAAGPPH